MRTRLTRRSLLAKGAVVFAPGRGRENDIGKAGGLGGEDVLADHELRRLQTMFHMADVGLGIGQVLPEDIKELDLAIDQAVHHLGHHQAVLFRELLHPPGGLELGPGRGVFHLLITGKDIGQRPHIAGPLDVVLAPQRVHPAAFKADIPQEHLQIGATHDVVDPAGVLGDPQGIDEHRPV